MKRWIVSGMLASAIAVTGFTIADAQSQGQEGRRPHRGGPGFAGRGFGGPGFGFLADLSEEQRKQVQAILQEERARDGRAVVMSLHRDLRAEILADVPDEQKIDDLRRKLAEAQGEALAHEIAVQRKLAQVLTPEQRAKARERLAEAPRGRR